MAIAIPADMKKGKVSWTIGQTTRSLTVALEGVSGVVTFTPTAVAIPYQTMTVLPGPQEAKVVAGVMQTIELTANDPEVWAWQVAPRLGPQDDIVPWPSWHINVPAGGTVDLATASVTPGVGPVKVIEGPQGPSAYDVAVANGYQGTQAQWLASLKGDGSAWSDVTGKPDVFPPAGHSHVVGDVTGLAARLAALEYDSGWRSLCRWSGGQVTEGQAPTGLAPRGTNAGGVFVRRYPTTVSVAVVEADVTALNPRIDLPSGFRGWSNVPFAAVPIYYRDANLKAVLANAEFGFGFVRYRDVPAGATLSSAGPGGYGVMATAPSETTLPTTLPGTPA